MVVAILSKSDKLLLKVLDLMKSDFSIQEGIADFKQVVSFIKFSKQKVFEKSINFFLRIPLGNGFKILFTSFSSTDSSFSRTGNSHSADLYVVDVEHSNESISSSYLPTPLGLYLFRSTFPFYKCVSSLPILSSTVS